MRAPTSGPPRLSLLLVLGLLVVPTASCQTDVILRFIDASSGKPIAGISVAVFAWDESRGRQEPPSPGVLQIDRNSQVIKTDTDGKAVFHLSKDSRLKTLYVDPGGDLRGCSAHEFAIQAVLQTGAVASYHTAQGKECGALKARATAKPREIVIFDKRTTVLGRMRQEIP